jgi:hypothetical protein
LLQLGLLVEPFQLEEGEEVSFQQVVGEGVSCLQEPLEVLFQLLGQEEVFFQPVEVVSYPQLVGRF